MEGPGKLTPFQQYNVWQAEKTLKSLESEKEYLAKLDQWENAAPGGEDRSRVANEIRKACEYRLQSDHALELRDFNISTFPPLPKKITELKLVNGTIQNFTGDLSQLKKLYMVGIQGFNPLSQQLLLSNLEDLVLMHCADIGKTSFERLGKLSSLELNWCTGMTALPDGVSQVKHLTIANCHVMNDFNSPMTDLITLVIRDCNGLTDGLRDAYVRNLSSVIVSSCHKFTTLPEKMRDGTSVSIERCRNAPINNCSFKAVPNLANQLEAERRRLAGEG